jgi:hypothetical protein
VEDEANQREPITHPAEGILDRVCALRVEGGRATARDLSPDVEYEIILESGEAHVVGLDFSLGDLRPGYVLDFDDNLVPTRKFPLRTTWPEAS